MQDQHDQGPTLRVLRDISKLGTSVTDTTRAHGNVTAATIYRDCMLADIDHPTHCVACHSGELRDGSIILLVWNHHVRKGWGGGINLTTIESDLYVLMNYAISNSEYTKKNAESKFICC